MRPACDPARRRQQHPGSYSQQGRLAAAVPALQSCPPAGSAVRPSRPGSRHAQSLADAAHSVCPRTPAAPQPPARSPGARVRRHPGRTCSALSRLPGLGTRTSPDQARQLHYLVACWVTFVTSMRITPRHILKERHHQERRRSRCVPVIMCTVTTSLLACTNGFTAAIRTPRPAAVDGDLVVWRCRTGAGHHLVIDAAEPARLVVQAAGHPGRAGGQFQGRPRRPGPRCDNRPSRSRAPPR